MEFVLTVTKTPNSFAVQNDIFRVSLVLKPRALPKLSKQKNVDPKVKSEQRNITTALFALKKRRSSLLRRRLHKEKLHRANITKDLKGKCLINKENRTS